MIGRNTQAYLDASLCTRELLEGCVLAIDPSIGSSNSMPGWAFYRAGQLVASGTIDLRPVLRPIPARLRHLQSSVRKLLTKYKPDVLVYEQIPAQRHGFGNAEAHASLLKALGVILSVPGPDFHVGIMPVSWKPLVSDDYEKGDEQDAIQMGRIIIDLAYQITQDQLIPKKGKKK